ncbi:MAG: hypothetical protein R2710_24620 [Acidimicrobiales bacterium]
MSASAPGTGRRMAIWVSMPSSNATLLLSPVSGSTRELRANDSFSRSSSARCSAWMRQHGDGLDRQPAWPRRNGPHIGEVDAGRQLDAEQPRRLGDHRP